MSEERIKERCKREDIAIKIVKGFLEKDCYSDTELFYSLETILNLIEKQQEQMELEELREENERIKKEFIEEKAYTDFYKDMVGKWEELAKFLSNKNVELKQEIERLRRTNDRDRESKK